jgi:hypothetical protein
MESANKSDEKVCVENAYICFSGKGKRLVFVDFYMPNQIQIYIM